MISNVVIYATLIIVLFIFIFLITVISRRLINTSRYKRLDTLRFKYEESIRNAIERDNISLMMNDLYLKPETIKFGAIEEVLFKLKETYPDSVKELFVRLGYINYYESNLSVRNRIKKATAIDKLGRIGDVGSIVKIAKVFEIEDRELNTVAIRALANIGTPQALKVILEHMERIYGKYLITRRTIETAFLKFDDRAISALIHYGRMTKNPKMIAIILDTLSYKENMDALQFAIENLYHSDPEVRAKALRVIGRFSDLLEGTFIKKLLGLADDPVWFVRLQVAKVCAKLEGNEIINAIEKLLRDKNWQVRTVAASALSNKKEKGLELILKILNGSDLYAKEGLCEEIERSGLYRVLIDGLFHKEEAIRRRSEEIMIIMNSLGFSTPFKEISAKEPLVAERLKFLFSGGNV